MNKEHIKAAIKNGTKLYYVRGGWIKPQKLGKWSGVPAVFAMDSKGAGRVLDVAFVVKNFSPSRF